MTNLEKIANSQIIPSRSKYQLENFVIKQHDTPEMQYQQILIEAADLAYKIKLAELNEKKTVIEIERLRSTGDEIDELTAQEKELGLGYTRLSLQSARYEFSVLEELFKQYPNYSYAEVEANQPDYWAARLTRQADLDIAQKTQGISAANLQSMLNAGILERSNTLEKGNDEIRNLEN